MPQTACATIATATSLRPWSKPGPSRPAERAGAEGEQNKRDRRGQREAGPCGERAEVAGTNEADRKADLARSRTGQELAQRDEIDISLVVEPAPADDELLAKIPDMGDRPAERAHSELEERQEDFERRTGMRMPARGLRRPARGAGHQA